MLIGEGIAFGSLTIAFLGLVYKFTSDEAVKRSRIYTRIDEIKKDTTQKLDDTKKDLDIKLQSKEICGIHNKRVTDDLTEIKADIKTLLKSIKG